MNMKAAYQDLCLTLDEADTAAGELVVAQKAYEAKRDEAIKAFEEAHADLTRAYKDAQARAERAKREASEKREALKEMVSVHWTENPTDTEPLEGVKIRHEKDVVYTPSILLKAAIKHAPFLLTIDEKAVKQFATALAIEQKGPEGEKLYTLPDHITDWLPVEVLVSGNPTISDKTLRHVAQSLIRDDGITKEAKVLGVDDEGRYDYSVAPEGEDDTVPF